MNRRGLLFVISGPSGVGKGTICKKLMSKLNDLHISISVTTRSPRHNEEHGKSYFFINNKEFKNMINKDQLLEWAEVYGKYYGTPRKWVVEKLDGGHDVLLEIDVQGALNVKSKLKESILVFIMPPSVDELKKRLISRGTDSENVINERLKYVKDEIKKADRYDYIVVNDYLDEALKRVIAIMTAEKCKSKRFDIKSYLYGDE